MSVPDYIFSVAWREGNFLIPADKKVRVELRQQLETYSRTGVMFLPGNVEVTKALRARLAAIEAYDMALIRAM